MKLTRRGWVVLAVVVGAVASGALFGARGLNAVAAPGVVALVAAAVQIKRIDPPAVTRELPRRVQRDSTVTVRLSFDVDRPVSAHIHDIVGDGLEAAGNDLQTTISGRPLEYDLHLGRRGNLSVGPTRIEARDVLGLVSEEFRFGRRDRILVLPKVHLLAGPGREDLVRLYGGAGGDREEVDHLRRYKRGDPLLDIHWKSSAKQPDDELVVKTFTADRSSKTIELVAASHDGHDDAMADAAASIAVALLDAGVRVGLTTPSGRITPEFGPQQRARILDHLATARGGLVPAGSQADADVLVDAGPSGVTVEIDGLRRPFSEFAGEPMESADGERLTVAA